MSIDTLSAAKVLKGAGFDHLATKDDVEKAVMSLKLFVASTVLGGAALIVLAQIVTKALVIAA